MMELLEMDATNVFSLMIFGKVLKSIFLSILLFKILEIKFISPVVEMNLETGVKIISH
jgi:hypothetical protein